MRTNNQFYISQKAYIEEILRAYKVGSSERDKIPLSKELADFDIQPGDLPPTPEAVAAAQEVTGKLMWVAQKSRPDLSFTCSLLSSLTTKAPSRCVSIGAKALRYLQATKEMRMKIQCDNTDLALFPDAAFAPVAGRIQAG